MNTGLRKTWQWK